MFISDKKRFIVPCSILAIVVGIFGLLGYYFWNMQTNSLTLENNLKNFGKSGEEAVKDLKKMPAMQIEKQDDKYVLTDETSDGISITYNKEGENQLAENNGQDKPKFQIDFPADYQKPIEVKLDAERIISIVDNSKDKAKTRLLFSQETITKKQDTNNPPTGGQEPKANEQKKYLSYETNRKKIIYAYQKDQSTGEKKLKNWIVYENGNGQEQESYTLQNAKIKKNSAGEVEVFYFGQKEMQSQQAAAEVAPSLLERAQKTLEKEMGEDILNSNNPDFIIPKPYFLDKDGNRTDLEWSVDEQTGTISLEIKNATAYPLALDPTLSFTAPGQSNSGNVITGEAGSSFGVSMISGDFNADGKIDLAVGASGYSSNTGRVYIFYSGSIITENAASADFIITGEASIYFGQSMTAGDFNADGKTDLAVGAYLKDYVSSDGRVYIFYNDGSIPTTAVAADVIITGETNSALGTSITAGDFNADGKTDLAVGASEFPLHTYRGRAYVFYNGAITTENASGADVVIEGEGGNNYFGCSMTSGDFNADGKTDLAVGALSAGAGGRAYVFYNDGSIPTTAATADVIITGEANSRLGYSMTSGDFNADGKTDLAVNAPLYASMFFNYEGRVYIFYGGSITTENVSGADVTITGASATGKIGDSMIAGDFNADGKTDLAVGSVVDCRAYIFYNDGSIPTSTASADVIITGESSSYFGYSMTSGDFNADGKTDLTFGSYTYSSNAGRAYIFYSQNGQVNTNFKITGEASSKFGVSMTAGDFNADGKTDLAVGAQAYSSATGRAYVFYGDGSIPVTAATADVIITGEVNSQFGNSMTAGDFNADGKTDLAVGGYYYSSWAGRAYVFYNGSITTKNASSADAIITGEGSSIFGHSMTAGDFNADGKTDLAVGAYTYSGSEVNQGCAYIFYNGFIITENATGADVIITGEASSNFGYSMTSGDFNADGKTDLAVGAYGYSSFTGRAYIFYNGSIITENAFDADVIITGEASSKLGASMVSGDFNADGKIDLAVGAYAYSSNAGRVYIFYNGSITTENATGADVTITGEASSGFGSSMTAGDFNANGKTDLAVGAYLYSSNAGRAYILYNDGSIPTTAATADIIITGEAANNYFGYFITSGDFNADGRTDLVVGAADPISSMTGRVYVYETRENYAWQMQPQKTIRTSPISGQEMKITGEAGSDFGSSMISGDFNADGKTDLAVGAYVFSGNAGRVYIFYNDGSVPTTAVSGADVIITGEASSYFGQSMTSGDFNADGKTDLAIGAFTASSDTGRTYIFYNDGSIPTMAATADVIITGEAGSDFGSSVTSGDFNADGKTDLAVGAYLYSSVAGRAYIFYNGAITTENATDADVVITGEASSFFGYSMTSGDFNADGETDLAVGAYGHPSVAGRAYIFYNGAITTENATGADVIITGQASSGFGWSMTSGDFNADGKTDLAVGAYGYSSGAGRAYIFYNGSIITENASDADAIITGQSSSQFGISMTAGDFNADGKTDLAVGAHIYSSSVGRAYIFHNGSIITENATGADVIITGEDGSCLGNSMTSGDFNADGKVDLAVGGYVYNVGPGTSEGRVYLYTFNDPVLTGDASSNLGISMIAGDFNADGKTDLVVGANTYSSNAGRAYVFYNDGVIPSTVATADAIITGEVSSLFGSSMMAGDFNADGKIDLAVSAKLYSSVAFADEGRAYIFYNGSIITENASGADVIITGEAGSNLGASMTAGDFNADGKTDLAMGASGYSSDAGRAYIFYNGSIITENASSADAIITGQASSYFGDSMTSGDFNADGKIDLAVGAYHYDVDSATNEGRAYIFYNGAIITENATGADVIITGETSSRFGYSMTSGDFNADGKTDLAVGAHTNSSNAGRVYIFNNGSITTKDATGANTIITGESSSGFGYSMTAGDFNADGKTDLVVGAPGYSSNTGRIYVFYGTASFPSSAASANLTFTGETTNNVFGYSALVGDFNNDGKTDLAVGAPSYSSSAGRFYVYSMESNTGPLTKIKTRGTSTYRGNVRIK